MLRTPSVQQESTPPRLTGPSALQGLFLLLTRGAGLKAQLYSSYGTVVLKKKEKKFSLGPTEMDFPATFRGWGGDGLVSPLLGQSQYICKDEEAQSWSRAVPNFPFNHQCSAVAERALITLLCYLFRLTHC